MRAGGALRAAGLDTEELRAFIHPVDPDEVRLIPAPAAMRLLWARDVAAVTIGRLVFVHPAALAGDAGALGRLVVHELVHARQWSDYGGVGFFSRYLSRYLRGLIRGLGHRTAYRSNPYEMEAREAVDRYGALTG